MADFMGAIRRLERFADRRLIAEHEHLILDFWIRLPATAVAATAHATVVVRPIGNEAIAIDAGE
jgi:hypothetical protein